MSLLQNNLIRFALLLGCIALSNHGSVSNAIERDLQVAVLWRHVSTEAGCEIGCSAPIHNQLLVTASGGLAVLEVATGVETGRIRSPQGFGATSVAHSKNLIAVAWAAEDRTSKGKLELYSVKPSSQGKWQKVATFAAGHLPDMATFSPDGRWLLAANEGEPSDDYRIDPPGSITAIDLREGGGNASVHQLTFEHFDSKRLSLREEGVRIFGPSLHHADGQATTSEDIEPEYVAVSADSSRAWVSLQENNAIAEIDLTQPAITAIHPLGLKSFRTNTKTPSQPKVSRATGLDVSDTDGGARIRHWPVLGMPQPDAIGVIRSEGQDYLITVNEGDPRKYPGFDERGRVATLSHNGSGVASASFHQALLSEQQLGRLEISLAASDENGDGDFEQLCVFGTRSFSIWHAQPNQPLMQVFDSGHDFEWITSQQYPQRFNADSTPTSVADARSPHRGPEPEGLAIGKVGGKTLAAIGLERTGGVMLYDISSPAQPRFVRYIPPLSHAKILDCAPEGLVLIEANKSPTGQAMLIVCNEGSGTVTAYELSWK